MATVGPGLIVNPGRFVARRVEPLERTTYQTPIATKPVIPTPRETFDSR
jgi:hypothetical protein